MRDYRLRLEVWKPIPCSNGYYAASTYGRIKRLKPGTRAKPGKIMKPSPWGAYLFVWLSCGGVQVVKSVHQFVMDTFVGPRPVGKEVNHKDLVKTHNWLDNLEYVTSSGNKQHARQNGAYTPQSERRRGRRCSRTRKRLFRLGLLKNHQSEKSINKMLATRARLVKEGKLKAKYVNGKYVGICGVA